MNSVLQEPVNARTCDFQLILLNAYETTNTIVILTTPYFFFADIHNLSNRADANEKILYFCLPLLPTYSTIDIHLNGTNTGCFHLIMKRK